MSKINPATMKGPGDFDPPEHDGPTCSECGGDAVDEDETIRCLDDECGHEETYEDPRIAAYEDRMMDDDFDY